MGAWKSLADTSREEVMALIETLNADDACSGILCQLPVPDHLDGIELTNAIDPLKDVDGLTRGECRPACARHRRFGCHVCLPVSEGCWMTPAWQLRGAEAVVIGRSNLFGQADGPVAAVAYATVTVCHSRTRDLVGGWARGARMSS